MTSKKIKARPKLKASDVSLIVLYIRQCSVQGTGRITWRQLAEKFGYTSVSLRNHEEIYEAYKAANVMVAASQAEDEALAVDKEEKLKAELKECQQIIEALYARFQRIAYHLYTENRSLDALLAEHPNEKSLSERQVNKILSAWDKPLPALQ